MTNNIENVSLLQGGGPLGAFGCGAYKALINNNINIYIIAGTSIGGINAVKYPDLRTQNIQTNY